MTGALRGDVLTADPEVTTAAAVDLSIVMVSYNTRDLMEQALRTVIEASAGLEVEIFVVDNASRDGSADMVEAKFPEVHLIRNSDNVGFAAGNNVAFRRGCGRHVLLLNSDTIVRPDTLRCLVEFLDTHPRVGAAGCKILNPDGTLQLESRRGFPTPTAAFCKLTGLSKLFPNNPRLARYNLTFLDPDEASEVDALSGSCMMVRRSVMEEVGPLDEAYFMYGEDLDWCYRMSQAGWKIYYVPHTEIIHFKGESGRAEEMRIQYRKNRAMAIFVRKHMKRRYRFFPLWLLHVGIVLYGVYSFAVPLARKLALPAVDGILVLLGLRLGMALRYHPDLIPQIHAIERLGNQFGLDVHPTRWLTPPPYSETEWFLVYAASLAIWLIAFRLLGLYDERRFSPSRAALAVALGFGAIVTTIFFFKAYNFSRLAAGGGVGVQHHSRRRLAAGHSVAHGRRRSTRCRGQTGADCGHRLQRRPVSGVSAGEGRVGLQAGGRGQRGSGGGRQHGVWSPGDRLHRRSAPAVDGRRLRRSHLYFRDDFPLSAQRRLGQTTAAPAVAHGPGHLFRACERLECDFHGRFAADRDHATAVTPARAGRRTNT